MVADQLKMAGVGVRFSSFGEAASYIDMHGYRCSKVPPVEFAWNLDGGFSVKHSLANIPLWFTNFWRQVNQEIRNMIAINPNVVVSDSRLSPILAARILRIPCIVVLNQVKLLLSPRLRQFAISRFFETIVAEFLGSMWALADRILVPDLPPPHTVSGHNIWGTGSASHRLEYVGFTTPRYHASQLEVAYLSKSLGLDASRPLVFIHVSGPSQTRMNMMNVALKTAEVLKDRIQFVFSEGRAGGETQPRRMGSHGWYYEWCPVRDELFTLSDLVILRGGHVALSQAIHFGKPVVTIPIENHGEQLGNSAKIAELGMGIMLHPKGLDEVRLAAAISEALRNRGYAEKARELQGQSEQLNGIDTIGKIIRSYL